MVLCALRLRFRIAGDDAGAYEERITIWQAADHDEAIESAEAEALDYAGQIEDQPLTYLGPAQAYELTGRPGDGVEVFSLVRDSHLRPADYLDAFFDTGQERQL